MNAPIPFRLHVMLAAQRARADGFPHFAGALADMLRSENKTGARYSIPAVDSLSEHRNQTSGRQLGKHGTKET
jgi:hypothetical protein